jgi:membrane-associated HD superfamily phosphohydrolase
MKNTKKTNQKTEELIKKIDSTITDLVYEKSSIIKAYNYYHGKRDADQFRHLEENYGIGTPTSVEFVPLVRKHIDVLVGEYISTPITPKISCKDSSTLENILKEKEKTITNDIVIELRKYLQSVLSGTPDKDFHKSLESKISFLNKEYLSDYEIAGQNIIDYLMQARNIDFHNKRKLLLIDLLVAGICYFRIAPTPSKTNISFRVLNPINTFIDRDYESPYLKDSSRAVIREFLTKQQILARYGEYINKEDLEELESLEEFSYDEAGTVYLRAIDSVSNNMSDGILGGFEVSQQNSNEG